MGSPQGYPQGAELTCAVCSKSFPPHLFPRHEVVDGAFRGRCAGGAQPPVSTSERIEPDYELWAEQPCAYHAPLFVNGCSWCVRTERIEPGAEAARRDDLARDVARLWVKWRDADGNYPLIEGGWIGHDVSAALDRLADAYGLQD